MKRFSNIFKNVFKTKKGAFTLAEVLITLGVIGVVAAMTIPTLMHGYQKKVTETKLKNTYAILQQAIRLAFVDGASMDEFVEDQNVNALKTWSQTYLEPPFKNCKSLL